MSSEPPTPEIRNTDTSEKNQNTGVWKPAFKEAALCFLLAWVILAGFYALFFFDVHPEFEAFAQSDAQPRTITGNYFTPKVMGAGRLDGTTAIISEFLDGEAVLATTTLFRAEDYPFIKFNIQGLTTWANAAVFWRTAKNPGDLHTLTLNRSWSEVTQVAMPYSSENYQGQIVELAIGFFSDATKHDNNGEPIQLIDVELRPFSALRVLEQVFEDWTNPPLWQGYSNNIVRGIHDNGMIFPNVVANLLVVIGLVVAILYRMTKRLRQNMFVAPQLLAVSLCLCLYGWAFNDVLRWHWRIAQLSDTQERYAGLPLEERIRNNHIRCARRDDCYESLLPYF